MVLLVLRANCRRTLRGIEVSSNRRGPGEEGQKAGVRKKDSEGIPKRCQYGSRGATRQVIAGRGTPAAALHGFKAPRQCACRLPPRTLHLLRLRGHGFARGDDQDDLTVFGTRIGLSFDLLRIRSEAAQGSSKLLFNRHAAPPSHGSGTPDSINPLEACSTRSTRHILTNTANLPLPPCGVVDRIVFGTVIARMAHAHLRHPGPFEACRCAGPRIVPSALAARLMVP